VKALSLKTGHIASFTLHTFEQGVNYRFTQEADWAALYRQLNKTVEATRAKQQRPGSWMASMAF
jgi:hypothetical protein